MYVCRIYTYEVPTMSRAKVFMSGGSQAVRLPAEFRFDTDEVEVRRDPFSGDVVLSKPPASWDDYFDWVRLLDLPADALSNREQPADDFRDPFAAMSSPAPKGVKRSGKAAKA